MNQKLLTLILSLFISTMFSQKLDEAKNNLKKDLTSEVSYSKDKSDTKNENVSFKEILAYELIVKPIVFISTYLAYGLFVEFPLEEKHSQMELVPYPYINQLRGDYAFRANEVVFKRFDISNQFLTDLNHTFGNNLNVKFRFLERANIEYNQLYLLEYYNSNNSQFFMHDITANYYRIRLHNFSLNYGLGLSHVHSDIEKTYFTHNTGFQYFLKAPISISLEHKGTASSNGVHQTKFNFNYHKNKLTLQAGFNFYDIGNIKYKMFALGGKIYL